MSSDSLALGLNAWTVLKSPAWRVQRLKPMDRLIETSEERASRVDREAQTIAKAHANIDAGLGIKRHL